LTLEDEAMGMEAMKRWGGMMMAMAMVLNECVWVMMIGLGGRIKIYQVIGQ